MYWWRRIGHEHRFQLTDTEGYGDRTVFKFVCMDCGALKTRIVSNDKGYDIEL